MESGSDETAGYLPPAKCWLPVTGSKNPIMHFLFKENGIKADEEEEGMFSVSV